MLEVSDQLFWESCRECSYHFTGLGVLEFYSQCLKSVTSCFGKAVGNAVSLHWPLGVGVLKSVLEVSDQLYWESCRECSHHFTGLGAPRTVPSRATPDER